MNPFFHLKTKSVEGQNHFFWNEDKTSNRYQTLSVAEPIRFTPMNDVTDLQEQIYLKQGELLCLTGFSDLEVFKEIQASWNFQLLGE